MMPITRFAFALLATSFFSSATSKARVPFGGLALADRSYHSGSGR